MNQLPSEIFPSLVRFISYKTFLLKVTPVPHQTCFSFASMYPRQVKMSNVYLNFFCLNFRWGEKLDIKISGAIPSGANSFVCGVKFNSRQEK